MYWRKKGLARRLSIRQAKKAWLSLECRSTVMMWSKPALTHMSATSLRLILPRLRILVCWL